MTLHELPELMQDVKLRRRISQPADPAHVYAERASNLSMRYTHHLDTAHEVARFASSLLRFPVASHEQILARKLAGFKPNSLPYMSESTPWTPRNSRT